MINGNLKKYFIIISNRFKNDSAALLDRIPVLESAIRGELLKGTGNSLSID